MAHSARKTYPVFMAGFTLIELLIVILIISIVSSVALLSINHHSNKEIETFATELAQTMTLAEEQAMLQPTVLGFTLTDQSFYFTSFQTEAKNQTKKWVPLDDTILKKQRIPTDIQLSLQLDDHATDTTLKNYPQIIISTNGDITPFTLYLGKKGKKPSYVLIGTADGNISYQALS